MVANGLRKEFSLKTNDYDTACQKATELDAVWEAPNKEVAFAQINAIKGFTKQATQLPLSEIWTKYEAHPDRARPYTEHEILMYKSTLKEFIDYLSADKDYKGKKKLPVLSVDAITEADFSEYSEYLKTTSIAVDTHNRKFKRLRKIFECLKDYCQEGKNPVQTKKLFRKKREEQDLVIKRQAFTKEQEQQIRDVLDNPEFQIQNKQEIRCVFYTGMFSGQRMKDCVLLQWQNVDMEHRRLFIEQFKTGKVVTIPIAPELYNVLLEAKNWQINQYVNPRLAERYNKVDSNGKNTGNNLVNLDVLRVIRWIGVEPSVSVPGRAKKMTVYGFHSLRHSFASFCAEAGVPKAVLLSILGTDSEIADKFYTHVGDDAQRQAIEAISGVMHSKSSQDKINEVLQLLEESTSSRDDLIREIREILLS